MLKWMFNLCK